MKAGVGAGPGFAGNCGGPAFAGALADQTMQDVRSAGNVPKKRLDWPPLGLRPDRLVLDRGGPAPGRPCQPCHRSLASGPVVARSARTPRPAAGAFLGLRGKASWTCHAMGSIARRVPGERDCGGAVKVMA